MNKETLAWLGGVLLVIAGIFVAVETVAKSESSIDHLALAACAMRYDPPNDTIVVKNVRKVAQNKYQVHCKWEVRHPIGAFDGGYIVDTDKSAETDVEFYVKH